jgi:hypothetical protein
MYLPLELWGEVLDLFPRGDVAPAMALACTCRGVYALRAKWLDTRHLLIGRGQKPDTEDWRSYHGLFYGPEPRIYRVYRFGWCHEVLRVHQHGYDYSQWQRCEHSDGDHGVRWTYRRGRIWPRVAYIRIGDCTYLHSGLDKYKCNDGDEIDCAITTAARQLIADECDANEIDCSNIEDQYIIEIQRYIDNFITERLSAPRPLENWYRAQLHWELENAMYIA